MTTQGNYLNMAQLRSKLGNRSRSSVYLDIEAGRLPNPTKLGGRLYWKETDIDALMSASPEELETA